MGDRSTFTAVSIGTPYQWVDYDTATITRRYDRIANLIPLFDLLFFLPRDLRKRAAAQLELRPGDAILEIGCGTGNSLSYLHDAVGPTGHVFGVDISSGMLNRARKRCDAHGWRNVELHECDAAEFKAPMPLDAALFTLTYNTIPQHRAVLRHVWEQLRPGGRLVIMDAKLPEGPAAKLLLPFSLWLMRHTMLANPLIQPWKELSALTGQLKMDEYLFGSYYICCGTKPAAMT